MTSFDVTPLELRATSDLSEQVGEQLRCGLSRLVGEVEDLLAGGWRGGAATAFGRGWTQWHAGADDVLVALDAMVHALATAGRAYDEADVSAACGLGSAP